jgi:hypothetical protein
MNNLIERLRTHYKALSPISSTLIKLYIPVIAVLIFTLSIAGASYLFTSKSIPYNLLLDCTQALKSTAGLLFFSLLFARFVK